MKRILVAGIGNIFLGDDAFGVEVLRALAEHALPDEVTTHDFGICGYDLACALTEGYSAVILVDALSHGAAPGTVFLVEPDLERLAADGVPRLEPHNLDPVRVLQAAQTYGDMPERIYLVGCEPGDLGGTEGQMGLSLPVRSAIPHAVELIKSVVRKLLSSEIRAAGAVPV
jgi:hydrogenase maturation protease